MRDRRPVDELSIDELERLLAIRKREARQQRLRRFEDRGRRVPIVAPVDQVIADEDRSAHGLALPQQHEAALDMNPVEPPVSYDITDDVPRFEDDIETERKQRRSKHPKRTQASPVLASDGSRPRALWDTILLGVEMVGVAGIVALLILGVYFVINESSKIEALEEQSAQIQRDAEAMRPTPSPRPELRVQLSDYVLPGGHHYNEGIGTFNLDELPESIKPAAIAQLNRAPLAEVSERPAYSPDVIEIPAIGVNASIWGGDDWYQMQKGVGHFLGSANPGEDANMVLSAHNDIFGEIFRDIEHLEPGDEIRVRAMDGRWYTYLVYDKQQVNPSDVWVLERGHQPIVTLITCYPYRVDTHRMVVFARLKES
jgi:sortase A